MAYQIGNRGNNRPQAPAQGNGDWERAIGFINMWLPLPSGKRHKLGSIPLKASNAVEQALFDRLSADPEAVHALFGNNGAIEVDFRAVDTEQDPSKIDLGF